MKYKFSCPLEGCSQEMTIEANSEEEAVQELTDKAKMHLASAHPEVQKTDDQVKSDISSMMERVIEE